jgi:hypothetical protein
MDTLLIVLLVLFLLGGGGWEIFPLAQELELGSMPAGDAKDSSPGKQACSVTFRSGPRSS